MTDTKIAIFKGRQVRKTIYKNEWWFSVIDVVAALTDSNIPKRYWSDLKIKLEKEGFTEVYEKIVRLKLEAPDGKLRETDCADTETIFRIIQTIPSPKAEPFKRWLAKVWYERIQEIENPELATKRTRMLYKLKGYPGDWFELIFTMLGEQATTEIHRPTPAGGDIAGGARRKLEKRLGRSIVSQQNYLPKKQNSKLFP